MRLNKYQLAPIQAPSTINKVIPACPGSGKTTAMVQLYLALSQNGVSPESIAVMTFSRKAASQIKEKIEQATSISELAANKICTIHAFCKRSLEAHWVSHKVPKKEIWSRGSHMSRCKAPDFWLMINAGQRLDKERWSDDRPSISDIAQYISDRLSELSYDHLLTIDWAGRKTAKVLDDIYTSYMRYMKENNLTSYDMLLAEMEFRLRTIPAFRVQMQIKNQYVIVDECQDLFPQASRIITTISQNPGWNEVYK